MDSWGILLSLDMRLNFGEVPFLCEGFKLGQAEAALGGLLDILGMCPSIRTGLCGLVLLDIWISGKESGDLRVGHHACNVDYQTVRYVIKDDTPLLLHNYLMSCLEP